MNVIQFQEQNQQNKNHIVYGIVDHTFNYSHNKEVMKNIADWTIQNITIQGYKVLVSLDEDSLLQAAAATGASHAVILSTGTEFINSYDWFEYAEDYCNQDFFIAGHILDRAGAYYELHAQCYIINLRLYTVLKYPLVGQQELCSTHAQVSPHRSPDNWHDDYTPKWVKSGQQLQEYEHKCHGWNILRVGFAHGYNINVFDALLRDNKIHYYPEWDSYFTQINYAYNRTTFCSGTAIYLSNSETNVYDTIVGPIDQLIVTASGLNWMLYLKQYGFTCESVVKFCDYSYLTLEYMKHLVENWDGKEYSKFAINYIDTKFRFIGGNIPFCGSSELPEIDPKLWNIIKSTVKFEYHYVNLMDTTKNIDWMGHTKTTIINLSNIFNYIGTASARSVKDRVYAENSLIEKLKLNLPEAYVLFARRAADGFFTGGLQTQVTACKDLQLTEMKSLTKPTWHMNQDWL